MTFSFRIAGTLLVSKQRHFLLQLRDNLPGVSSPGMLSVFGGMAEANETLLDCAVRELKEETGLSVDAAQLEEIVTFSASVSGKPAFQAGFFVLQDVATECLAVTEGSLCEIGIDALMERASQVVPTSLYAISLFVQLHNKQQK